MPGEVVLPEPDVARGRPSGGSRNGRGEYERYEKDAKDPHDSGVRRKKAESYAKTFESATMTMGTRKRAAVKAASLGLLLRIVL